MLERAVPFVQILFILLKYLRFNKIILRCISPVLHGLLQTVYFVIVNMLYDFLFFISLILCVWYMCVFSCVCEGTCGGRGQSVVSVCDFCLLWDRLSSSSNSCVRLAGPCASRKSLVSSSSVALVAFGFQTLLPQHLVLCEFWEFKLSPHTRLPSNSPLVHLLRLTDYCCCFFVLFLCF